MASGVGLLAALDDPHLLGAEFRAHPRQRDLLDVIARSRPSFSGWEPVRGERWITSRYSRV